MNAKKEMFSIIFDTSGEFWTQYKHPTRPLFIMRTESEKYIMHLRQFNIDPEALLQFGKIARRNSNGRPHIFLIMLPYGNSRENYMMTYRPEDPLDKIMHYLTYPRHQPHG